MGIFLPEKDADWEFDLDAYENLNETPAKICDATNCEHKLSFNDLPEMWKLCSTCGFSSIHIFCMEREDTDFVCCSCDEILKISKKTETKEVQEQSTSSEQKPASDAEDSPIRKPKNKRAKFIPWFSDDEQVDEDSSDEELVKETKRKKQESRTPSKLITPRKFV